VVGKNVQTRSPGDHRFPSPNVIEDDYRAVEIFPPMGHSKSTYSYTWFEDDGISQRPDISSFTVRYSSDADKILVEFEEGAKNKFVCFWKELSIILPVGDLRPVVLADGNSCCKAGQSRGRAVYTIPL